MPLVGQCMLTDAVSLQNDEILRRLRLMSFSSNAIRRSLKTCRSFLVFVTKQQLCQYYFPYKRKLLKTHAILKELPNIYIFFPMIKKMPLNILQPKNYRYTHRLVPAEVSEVIGLFVFCPFFPHSKNCIRIIALKTTSYSTKLVILHNLDLV